MSVTTFLLIVFGVLLALLVLFVLVAVFAVELLRKLLRRTPLAPFVAPKGRAGRGNYGMFADDGE